MTGEDQRAHHDDQDQGGEEDGDLVVFQPRLLTGSGFLQKPFHHKDAVVHADTEHEGGDDDVDQIEFQAEEGHEALQGVPGKEHREEGYQRNPQIPERDQQDQQHEERGDQQRLLEVVVDDLDHVPAVVERLQDHGLRTADQCIGHGIHIFRREGNGREDHPAAAVLLLDERGKQRVGYKS